MSWAIWLAVPAGVTLLAAVYSWLRSRPRPELSADQAMRAHNDYLDALARTPRAKDRGPYAPVSAPAADPATGSDATTTGGAAE